jgi:hypothetical protein
MLTIVRDGCRVTLRLPACIHWRQPPPCRCQLPACLPRLQPPPCRRHLHLCQLLRMRPPRQWPSTHHLHLRPFPHLRVRSLLATRLPALLPQRVHLQMRSPLSSRPQMRLWMPRSLWQATRTAHLLPRATWRGGQCLTNGMLTVRMSFACTDGMAP